MQRSQSLPKPNAIYPSSTSRQWSCSSCVPKSIFDVFFLFFCSFKHTGLFILFFSFLFSSHLILLLFFSLVFLIWLCSLALFFVCVILTGIAEWHFIQRIACCYDWTLLLLLVFFLNTFFYIYMHFYHHHHHSSYVCLFSYLNSHSFLFTSSNMRISVVHIFFFLLL